MSTTVAVTTASTATTAGRDDAGDDATVVGETNPAMVAAARNPGGSTKAAATGECKGNDDRSCVWVETIDEVLAKRQEE